MSNTFTAQELADFYQKVADGSEVEYLGAKRLWQRNLMGPDMHTEKRLWRIKPTQKVIDLSVLIESGIDCEFKDSDETGLFISKLSRQSGPSEEYRYYDGEDTSWDECQPRMNHKHAWDGGECPLPEGFRVKVWFRNTLYAPADRLATSIRWCHDGDLDDIIAFEVLEKLANDYVMP